MHFFGSLTVARQSGSIEQLVWIIGGVYAGFTFAQWLEAERGKSRAEAEDPERTHELAEEVDELLNEIELESKSSEIEYQHALADFLREHLGCEVEENPRTPCGEPDILIDSLLALEIKRDIRKTECDRCAGQVAGFAREWMTFVVVFDTPASRVRQLADTFDHASLDLPIVDFD